MGLAFALVFWLADPATVGHLVRPVSVELTPMLDNVRLVSRIWLVISCFSVHHSVSVLVL